MARVVVTPVRAVQVHLGVAELAIEIDVRVAEGRLAVVTADAQRGTTVRVLLVTEDLALLAVGDHVRPATDGRVAGEDLRGLVEALRVAHDDVADDADGRAAELHLLGEHVLVHGEREARLVHRRDAAERRAGGGHGGVALPLVGLVEDDGLRPRPARDAVVVEVPCVEELAVARGAAPRDGAGAAEAERHAVVDGRPRPLELHETRGGPQHRVGHGGALEERLVRHPGPVGHAAHGLEHERGHLRRHARTDGAIEHGDERAAGGAEALRAEHLLDERAVVRERAGADVVGEQAAVLAAHLVRRALHLQEMQPGDALLPRGAQVHDGRPRRRR